jgi:glutamate-1-semialdehyde 2,1-aminomutase
MEAIRFANSGTEATMHAIRVARAFTGRSKIAKFEGAYHGTHDWVLVSVSPDPAQAGSRKRPKSVAWSAGVPPAVLKHVLVLPWNDLAACTAILEKHAADLAALIIDPMLANAGMVPAREGFLEGLREVTARLGILLIFDEVISFRVASGGAQERFGIRPDLTILGKILGGGLPAAAFGGRAELMDRMAPVGPVYQAGTLSGNPLAMAAGAAALRELARPGTYARLEGTSRAIADGLRSLAGEIGVELTTCSIGGMFGLFFHPGPVRSYTDARKAHAARFRRFFHAMLDDGIYLAPSPFEAGFVSLAHRAADVDRTLEAARGALRRAARVR